MFEFHRLPVESVERIAEDALCVTLSLPASARERFAFHAGQYITVNRKLDGRDERRTYSIVSPPSSARLRIGVRLVTGGRVSSDLAANLRAGDLLEVGTPLGRFRTKVDPQRSQNYVAFASGSGITPVLSLATDILMREPQSRFTLIYGNRSMSRTMFLEDTLALKNRFMGRFTVHFVMSREPQHTEVLNGRIDAAKVLALSAQMRDIADADEYFVCGPGQMVDEVSAALKDLNPKAAVRFERFAATAVPAASIATPAVTVAASANELLASISVTIDGRTRSFPMAPGDESVLSAAERAGLELPYSCRSGICATCRTRIVEGNAVMTHNIALEPWEQKAGFILCCQARPTTPTLALSYDEK
jgi:ring-1,2-phenylacetyl-CoA epoxidase subunit PaaE